VCLWQETIFFNRLLPLHPEQFYYFPTRLTDGKRQTLERHVIASFHLPD
jgi:hypothetical protein